ncbi:MAG: hypothetical protein R3F14_02405 [Polyangiaceae bacterium]
MSSRLASILFTALPLTLAACNSASTTGSETAGAGGSGGSGTGGVTETTSTTKDRTTPDPMFLPAVTGACPDFTEGTITVSPDGKSRDLRLWISDAAASLDGPIVFFWHGVGGSPNDALYALGTPVIDEIKALGGMVIAPVHDPDAGTFPWYLTTGGTNDSDIRVMDEALACAIQKVGVDLRHIHSTGFSAGAMNTTQVGWWRSGYIASVVTFSGAQIGTPPDQDPENKFPAMVVHGGADDIVVIEFSPRARSTPRASRTRAISPSSATTEKATPSPPTSASLHGSSSRTTPSASSPSPTRRPSPRGSSYCSL